MGSAYHWLGRLGFWLLYLTGGVTLASVIFQVATGRAIDWWQLWLVLMIAPTLHRRVQKCASRPQAKYEYSLGFTGFLYCCLLLVWLLMNVLTGSDADVVTAVILAVSVDVLLGLLGLVRQMRSAEAH